MHFIIAGEFARPLFMVACLDVTLMYAGPAAHNLKLPWTASPLATSTSASSSAAATASASQTKEATPGEQAERLAWELYEEEEGDGEPGVDEGGRGRAKGSDTARARMRDELARGTAGRREYTSLDAAQAYGEPAEEDVR
jgi:hypothetical protein